MSQNLQITPKLKIGWALMRVSTKQQAEVQHGSLEQQRHMLERWSLQQSEGSNSRYEITRFFEEDISGRGKAIHKRMALMEIERAIETKSIDFVVFEKVDRLARDIIYNLGLVKKAQENGVEVHEFESGQIDLRDRGSRLGFNIKNLLAEEYSLDLEEKITKKQREARINNGKDTSTVAVLGLDPHPAKRGMYVINKKEQEIVLDIFKKFIEVGSLKSVAEYCKERHYVTKSRMTKEKSDKEGNIIPPQKVGGDPIDSAYLRNIFTNPKIRGFAYFKDSWNQFPKMQDTEGMVRWEYPHGSVVPLDIFDEAQAVLEKNAKFNCRLRGPVYYLSSILYYEDGSKFSGAGAHGRNTEYQYYHCPKKSFRIRKDKIENFIINRVKHYLANSDILKKMIDDTNAMTNMGVPILAEQVLNLRKRLTENKKVIDGFSSFVRQSALTNPSQLDSVIRTITAERDKAETETMLLERELANKENQLRELKSENQEKGMREHLEELLENFDNQEDKKKRDIIQLIIQKAIVHKDNKLEIWIRRDIGSKASKNLTGCASQPDFGHECASYQPPVGMERRGDLIFSNSGDSIIGSEDSEVSGVFTASSNLSRSEESGSSELKMAGWTGIQP
ncbi:MAG TPA: recombinase family protein [Pseudobdellovibrionaceae bacterium]|jgi:DNA invertase Pin-like site-specific DNA recombinase